MRKKVVELKTINGGIWYVPEEEFTSFNVPETPESVISNYIRGSKGPLIKVNNQADMAGETKYINANFIVEVKITYG